MTSRDHLDPSVTSGASRDGLDPSDISGTSRDHLDPSVTPGTCRDDPGDPRKVNVAPLLQKAQEFS